jgi:hypothetical protein
VRAVLGTPDVFPEAKVLREQLPGTNEAKQQCDQ